MAAGRKQLIHELQAAEARLEARWQQLQDNSEMRLDYLRRMHPAWLIGSGFVSGVLVERLLTVWAGSATASRVVAGGIRLWPLLSAGFPAAFLMAKPTP